MKKIISLFFILSLIFIACNRSSIIRHQTSIITDFPSKPIEKPLPWAKMANEFDAFIMDSTNQAIKTLPNGHHFFPSDLNGNSNELTTYGVVTLGKILRNNDVNMLIPSLDDYFNTENRLFLNVTNGEKIEYWYLLNVDALAAGIIRSKLLTPKYLRMQRNTADALIQIAKQINYNFNDQGFDFSHNIAWTNKNIYRQHDVIGGYAYLMLISYELLGDSKYLKEAKKSIALYQNFDKNPWYEIPSGSMACLTAARLQAHYGQKNIKLDKILRFALDSIAGPLQTGNWGGKEINGLMRGWGGGERFEAYSMESLVAPMYILPILRYNTKYAVDLGKYFLNLSANMRYFYSKNLPKENQSKPELPGVMPYERLTKEEKGHSPYAGGDFGSQRSIYGGAYVLWMGEIVKPTNDPYILQVNISTTDFLAKKTYPTYLYYNPYKTEKTVNIKLPPGTFDLYETTCNKTLEKGAEGLANIKLPAQNANIVVLIPNGTKSEIKNGTLLYGDIEVDYDVN